MEKIIVANHKMNLDIDGVNEYLEKLKSVKHEFIVFPTSIYIPYFINENYKVGIQNVYSKDFGAFTGEVSPYQASKLGVGYVMIGHSERRSFFYEDNNLIKEKIKKCLQNNLKVILCVGETLEEKEDGKTFEVLKKDLSVIDNPENIMISYEPRWAIGSGKTPTNDEIEGVVKFIKKCYNVKVLYGGSVSEDNIATLNQIKSLDGYLLGKASTRAEEVLKIIEVTRK